MKLMLLGVRLLIGSVLLWAGLAKARQPYEFLAAVYGYRLVGPSIGLLIAATIPWLEIFVGCCLMTGILLEGSLLVATGLAGSFTLFIASAWHRGLSIRCGCFGGGSDVIDAVVLVRAVCLLVVSLLGLVLALMLRRATAPGRPPSSADADADVSVSPRPFRGRLNPESHRPSSPFAGG